MKKKFTAIILIVIPIVSAIGCGDSPDDSRNSTDAVGEVSFYSDTTTNEPVSIFVDSKQVGVLNYHFPFRISLWKDSSYVVKDTPVCGVTGTLTIVLSPGQHNFSASSKSWTWPAKPFHIMGGSCQTYGYSVR